MKIGAKAVHHARYVVFQLAEVAVPKDLFEKILRLIDGLQPRPASVEPGRSDASITTGEVCLNDRERD